MIPAVRGPRNGPGHRQGMKDGLVTKLSVNLNKVALLRNQRNIGIPDVVAAARTAIRAGAYGITVHPRPDERHIRRSDVTELAAVTAELGVEFNVEGYPDERYLAIARDIRPTQCTLVPDAPDQLTSDHGWNLRADAALVTERVRALKALGCRVSLFMDPDLHQIELAKDTGTDRIELYTEPYASAHAAGDAKAMLQLYDRAARHAQQLGLGVNAGHDLNLKNLPDFCTIPGILEVSIGHALIADALDMGIENTVRAYLDTLRTHGMEAGNLERAAAD